MCFQDQSQVASGADFGSTLTTNRFFSRKYDRKSKNKKRHAVGILSTSRMFLTECNYFENPARTIHLKKITFCAQLTEILMEIINLDRILTRIIGFRIQILPKFHKITQLPDHFPQRVLRVRQKQNILGLSTRRELSISEEI